jgi:hypothetical protein
MKLIRLLSDGSDTSLFTANLRDNVKIKAGSKVALKSLSMEILDKNLVVDSTNSLFRVKMGTSSSGDIDYDDEYKTIALTQATYSQTQLIDELTSQLNKVLSSQLYFDGEGSTQSKERTDLGFQWKADLDIGGGLILGFNRSANEIVATVDCVLNQMEEGSTENTFINSDPDPRLDQFTSSILWDDPLCKGGFRTEFNVKGLELPADETVGDGTKINYGQFFCGLLPYKYQNTLNLDDFILSAGCDWKPNDAEPTFIIAEETNIIFPNDEGITMEIGDYLAFDVYLGTYNVVEPVEPAEIELQLDPVEDIEDMSVGDYLFISYIEAGNQKTKEVQIIAINVPQGKIALSESLSNDSQCTDIDIYILQDSPYFRKIINIEQDQAYSVTLDYAIHPNLDAYVVAKQNFVFYKTYNGAREFPINPNTGLPFKLRSNSSFLMSRQNLNSDNIPAVVVQLSYNKGTTTENYNLAIIPLEGDANLNNTISNSTFYMGLTAGMDIIGSGTDTLKYQYSMYGTIDPFINVNETTGEVTEVKVKDLNTIQYHKLKAIEPSIVDLNFLVLGVKTAQLLGFKLLEYSVNNVADVFAAEYPLLQNAVPGDVLVEIQNIPFETYDSRKGGRQNVIYIMNKANFESNILDNRFDSNIVFPVFMSIHNAQDLNLNSFTIRITSEGQPLKVKNNKDISVVLLVED